jgi:hypothetical protein
MNAMNAVALAGGFTPSAVESVVFIRREDSNKEDEVPVDRTTTIRPGDVVKVHNTIFSEAVGFQSPFSGVAASAATAAVLHSEFGYLPRCQPCSACEESPGPFALQPRTIVRAA